jgi:hypothetical protein
MSDLAALQSKLRHARVLHIPISDIEPSPENLQLYRPVDSDDPDIIALAESIRIYGVREPLVVTLDYRHPVWSPPSRGGRRRARRGSVRGRADLQLRGQISSAPS